MTQYQPPITTLPEHKKVQTPGNKQPETTADVKSADEKTQPNAAAIASSNANAKA